MMIPSPAENVTIRSPSEMNPTNVADMKSTRNRLVDAHCSRSAYFGGSFMG